jgi:tetratricopeptide (TPR) repeat protein
MELAQPLLQAVAEMPGEALHRGLAHLQAAEFLYETSLYPEHVYTFKHALTHEVAYGSVLQDRRRALHARIVEAIEALYPDRLAEQIERLAHHAFRSEVWEKAVTYLQQAGAKAVAHSSSREALAHFEKAMTALSHLPETRQTLERGIDLRLDLRNALHTLAAWKRIEANLREAERLATMLDDQRRLGWVSAFMCAHHVHTGGAVTDVRACAQRVEAIAQSTGDETLQVVAQYYAFYPFYLAGDYHGTEQSCRRLMDAIRSDRAYERFGLAMFPAVPCRAYLARALAERGLFEEGDAHGHEAIRIAEAHQHPFSIVWASLGQAYLDSTRGEPSKTARGLERSVALCREWSLTTYLPVTMAALGHTYAWSGRLEEGISLLQQALALYESEGVGYEQVISVVHLGEASLLANRVEEARTCADRAVTLARGRGERGYEAWACRLLGEIASHHACLDEVTAAAYYGAAMTLATELGMRPLQAHCHRGLGTLYRQTGQLEQARAELSTAIEMYCDMEMTFWLSETEAALATVEGKV